MRALRAKKLLQILIGPGQLRDALAVNQAGPGAPAALQTVPYRWCEAPGFGLRLPHGPEQPVPPPLSSGAWLLGGMMPDVRGAMHPAIGHLHLGPQRRRRVQPTAQDRPQAPSRLGQGPLFSLRSRL